MTLNLYRRHRLECEAGRPEESRSGEFEERKKGWKRCACFIFASGTLDGNFKRKRTDTNDWDEARAVTTTWQQADSWEGKLEPVPALASVVQQPAPGRVSVADGIKVFLSHREGAAIAPATLRKYKTFT